MTRAALLLLLPSLLLAPAAARAQDDDPGRRSRYFLEQRRYPGTDALAARLQAARLDLMDRPVLSAPPARGAVGPGPWTPLGPQRIPQSMVATGRTSAIALHPDDDQTLYIGGAQGGVWKTTDGGVSWTALTDDQCSLAMGHIAIDPEAPDIVYAGTGELHFSGDSYYGCGILRSTDGGATWRQLGADIFAPPGAQGARVSRVRIDPLTAGSASATTVYAATSFGFYRSTDSGESWTRTRSGVVTDLVLHPDEPRMMYIGVFGTGVLRSDDGGQTWTAESLDATPSRVGRLNLAIAPSDGDVVYASIHDREEGDLLGIWATRDGGELWSRLQANNASCRTQCWYDMTLAVDPADPNIVFFGGVFLYRSDNGGGAFQTIMGSGSFIHVDQHYILVHPDDGTTVWVANDGGVYRSRDRGATWTSLNSNLALTQFYAGASIHPTDPSVVLGGTQDNGTVLSSGTPEWEHVLGGDGGWTAIHPLQPNIRWAETQWGGSFSGPRRTTGSGFSQRLQGIDLDDRGAFIPPLVMDPYEPETLYFGTSRVYRTTDGGALWTPISGHLTEGVITSVGPALSDGAVVWATSSRGEVFVTRDAGRVWTPVSAGIPTRWITDVAVHPTEPGTAWVTASGFGTGHVFVTRNFGASWTDASGDLPDLPVNTVLLDPGDPEQVFIGTDLGVFVSDGGGSWSRFDDGMPMVAVFDLAVEPNAGVMVASTHGRGAFSVPASAPLSLVLRDTEREATVSAASTLEDEVRVGVFGTGWPTATWAATTLGGASWLDFDAAEGDARRKLRWTIDPGSLPAGVHEETIRVEIPGPVTAAASGPAGSGPRGPGDGPWRAAGTAQEIRVRIDVRPADTALVSPDSRWVEVLEGTTDPLPDSAAVAVVGNSRDGLAWTASHRGAPWLTLVDSTGIGTGTVRWNRDPTGLAEGVHVDTIDVTGPGLVPGVLVDSLVVTTPLTIALEAPEVPGRNGTLAGLGETLPGRAVLALEGFGARSTGWEVTHGGAGWLSLETSEGTGADTLRWSRDPAGLEPGVYVETLAVTTLDEESRTATLVDTLRVAAAASLEDAARAILEGAGLDDLQEAVLDALGNGSGGYDVGDFLAWLARCEAGTAGSACPGAAALPPALDAVLDQERRRDAGETSDGGRAVNGGGVR